MANSFPRREVTVQEWQSGWWKKAPDPAFHRQTVSPMLVKNYEKLFSEGKVGRVFIPLCGKSLDLLYFSEKGHEVVGLEFSEMGVEAFFKENNLTYKKNEIDAFVVYKCDEKNISIYRGDIFNLKLDICGQFDGFYDRGSYVAINVPMQKKYADLIITLMNPGAKILMEATSYDLSKHKGPPHSISIENIKKNFGEKCSDEIVDSGRYIAPSHYDNPGMEITVNLCLISIL